MASEKQTSVEETVIKWVSQVNLITEKYKEEFLQCSEEQLMKKPSSDVWSIAENIQHIIEVNQSYFPIFSQLLADTYKPSWSGRFSFIYHFLGNLIKNSVSEDRNKKIKTFALWQPKNLPPAKDILDRFESHQRDLIEWIQKLRPYIVKNTVINSPANRSISYTLEDAIEIIIMHEKRHLNQAIEAKESIK